MALTAISIPAAATTAAYVRMSSAAGQARAMRPTPPVAVAHAVMNAVSEVVDDRDGKVTDRQNATSRRELGYQIVVDERAEEGQKRQQRDAKVPGLLVRLRQGLMHADGDDDEHGDEKCCDDDVVEFGMIKRSERQHGDDADDMERT